MLAIHLYQKKEKHLCDDAIFLSRDCLSNMREDGYQDPEGFSTALSCVKYLHNKATSPPISSTIPVNTESLTVVFVPIVATESMGKIRKLQLSNYFNSVAATELKEARLSTRKNLTAVDVVIHSTLDK